MAFGFEQLAFKRWEADLRLNCFLSSLCSTDAGKSFPRLWHLLTWSIRGWKQTQIWSDLRLVPVCAAHTDTEPWCAVAWAVLRHALCADATAACGCVGQTTRCAPRLALPWVSAWPWVVWYQSFNPRLVQTHAWNAVIWEAKDFFLEVLDAVPPMARAWNGRWWPAPPAQQMWVRIQDHPWENLRLVISWPGIHHMIAGTK